MARDVQMSLQPKEIPDSETHDIKAVILPAREVGGDLYDFFYIDESRIGLVIADVSGKGVPAALFTTVTRALLRAATSKDFSTPGECLTMVNELLCESNPSCIFITLFFGVLDEEFTEARLDEKLAELAGASSERVATEIVDAVHDFVEDAPQSDDITCVVARFRPGTS